MAKNYSETFIDIMETICERCNARSDDCYVYGNDAENCVLFGNDMLEMLKLCVRVDDIAYELENEADKAEPCCESYYEAYGMCSKMERILCLIHNQEL